MLQFAEAHMQVRAARNQVGWFKKQEHRVECELLPIYNLKLLILISSIKTTRSRSVLAERSQEVQQFQRPGRRRLILWQNEPNPVARRMAEAAADRNLAKRTQLAKDIDGNRPWFGA